MYIRPSVDLLILSSDHNNNYDRLFPILQPYLLAKMSHGPSFAIIIVTMAVAVWLMSTYAGEGRKGGVIDMCQLPTCAPRRFN